MKIYEDQALGKLSEERYIAFYNKYQAELDELKEKIAVSRSDIQDAFKDERSAKKFIKLVERYADFSELSPVIINEFVDKIMVHERKRKESMDTTQDIDVYFIFIGEYKPSTMEMPELSAEEMQKKVALRKKRHEQYLKRKDSGKQKEYGERYNKRRKEIMDGKKAARRAEDIEAGFIVKWE